MAAIFIVQEMIFTLYYCMSVDWWDINGVNAFSWLRLVALKTDWFAEERDS